MKINPQNLNIKNKHIKFDDDGSVAEEDFIKLEDNKPKKRKSDNQKANQSSKKPTSNFKDQLKERHTNEEANTAQKWYDEFSSFNTNGDLVELKDAELQALRRNCLESFEKELPSLLKKNPSDAKWLETALHKGTAKDRANAGALLVHTNPLPNLQTLDTLIGLCKVSNKSSPDVIQVLSDLFMDAFLPSTRKLLSLPLRGADWKSLRKREDVSADVKTKIYAYWYYENELKDRYFSFLQNLQSALQTGLDVHKNKAIIRAAQLLAYGPEKEQMILSMLVNKLGDPSNKIAAKALHHLSEVAFKHPNMCGVITTEAEKLLFRNNISEKAQHFALCFLSQIAPRGHSDVCTKLVNICFAFFKVLVKKGTVNNKTMQAILRCLRKAITDAKPIAGTSEIMNKEMQDTVYRLVHLSEIHISIQTLCLLLQLIASKSEKSDRFYNALYIKMLDLNLTMIGSKAAAQFLHIVHQAIYLDQNVSRAKAFIKRLLQMSLYMPSHIASGCLIVCNKLLRSRRELGEFKMTAQKPQTPSLCMEKFDSDEEEHYEDIDIDEDGKEVNVKPLEANKPKDNSPSWHHMKIVFKKDEENENVQPKTTEITVTQYKPYHRVPAYAGAEFVADVELLLLKQHLHPTVKVFAETILNQKNIDYYGDPLKDFSLTQFLERFCFKNPKKLSEKQTDEAQPVVKMIYNKDYVARGARGQPVTSLTEINCTEEERFILNYLQKKREKQANIVKDDKEDVESVDDDEFEEYLTSLGPKVSEDNEDEDEEDFDVDYIKELGSDLQIDDSKTVKQKKKKDEEDEEDEDNVGDWSDIEDEQQEEEDMMGSDIEDLFESEDEEDIDEENENMSSDFDGNEEDSDDEPKLKKMKKSQKKDNFNKVLKTKDMESLFAAADDFAEILENTGKTKGHGTINAVFNKDKSSEKQMKWEEKRRSDSFQRKGFLKKGRGKFKTRK